MFRDMTVTSFKIFSVVYVSSYDWPLAWSLILQNEVDEAYFFKISGMCINIKVVVFLHCVNVRLVSN